ncbi:unnamed protein product [Closterium sp. NIES-64]|nr:unnamed protein product [Closterium sp. NIES-64]
MLAIPSRSPFPLPFLSRDVAAKDAWSKPNIKGTPPSPRDSYEPAQHPSFSSLLPFPPSTLDSVQPRTRGASQTSRARRPSPRDSHTSTVVGSRLFVFGGTDGSSGLTTFTCSIPVSATPWRLVGDLMATNVAALYGQPHEHIGGQQAVRLQWHGNQHVVAASGAGGRASSTRGALRCPVLTPLPRSPLPPSPPSLASNQHVDTAGAQGDVPAAREGHAAARVEGLVYVFGGCGKAGEGGMVDETYYNDVHVFNPGDRNPFPMQQWHVAVTAGALHGGVWGLHSQFSTIAFPPPLPTLPRLAGVEGGEGEGAESLYSASGACGGDSRALQWCTGKQYTFTGVSSLQSSTIAHSVSSSLPSLPPCAPFTLRQHRSTGSSTPFTGVSSLQSSTIAHSVSSSLPSLPRCAPFYPPPASEHWQQYTPTGDVPSRRFSLSADLLDTVSGQDDALWGLQRRFGGSRRCLLPAYRFRVACSGVPPAAACGGGPSTPCPCPMDARMGMDGRMAMDAGVGMGAGGTPMGMRGKRGGEWRGRVGAGRGRSHKSSPALPPGLHPADLIAPAGREVPFEAQIVDVFHLGYCLRATVAVDHCTGCSSPTTLHLLKLPSHARPSE